jgi:ATP-binding cassette subfamily B protein
LDDSFSSVDTNTEELILRDLREHISVESQTTFILISHRISTIKNSDLIMVLDEGKIKDTGNHKELMKKSSIYQKLYYRQQLSEELAEEI